MATVNFDLSKFDPNAMPLSALLVAIDRLVKIRDGQPILTPPVPAGVIDVGHIPCIGIQIVLTAAEKTMLANKIALAQTTAKQRIDAGTIA